MNTLAIWFIKLYQHILRPLIGNRGNCVFYPTCSEYGIQAYKKYNFFKATWLTIRRISRCHPWQKNHIDPLP